MGNEATVERKPKGSGAIDGQRLSSENVDDPERTAKRGRPAASAKQGGSSDRRASSGKGRRNRDLGMRGESAAAAFLERRGYDILERNWTCNWGEADIIARDDENLVFVEVKTRRDCDKGMPEEAVNAAKRERYEKIAIAFLRDCEIVDVSVRFDVVSIVVIANDRALIRHHIGAFSAA